MGGGGLFSQTFLLFLAKRLQYLLPLKLLKSSGNTSTHCALLLPTFLKKNFFKVSFSCFKGWGLAFYTSLHHRRHFRIGDSFVNFNVIFFSAQQSFFCVVFVRSTKSPHPGCATLDGVFPLLLLLLCLSL